VPAAVRLSHRQHPHQAGIIVVQQQHTAAEQQLEQLCRQYQFKRQLEQLCQQPQCILRQFGGQWRRSRRPGQRQ
tara:strand:+ start:303 stop:524 length:222 start_codon:yes stop_codon:yes gene_type:complete